MHVHLLGYPHNTVVKERKNWLGDVFLMAVEFIILFNQADVQVFFWHFHELRKQSLVFLRGAVLLNYGTIWPYKSRKIWWLRIWINLKWKNIIMEWNDQW